MKKYESIARALLFAVRDLAQKSDALSNTDIKVQICFIPNSENARNLLELPMHESGVLGTEITTSIDGKTTNVAPTKNDDRCAILLEHPHGTVLGFSYASHPNFSASTDVNAKFEIIVALSSSEDALKAELSKLAGKAMGSILPFMRNSGFSSYCPI